jgi:UDP-N-acetylmuramyl tripeptide synthase
MAHAHGIAPGFITAGLRSFGASWRDNPGRGQLTELNGVRVMLDFGHNPDGVRALLDVVDGLLESGESRGRLSVCVGQAGDRSDDDIFELAQVIHGSRPSKLYLRSMKDYLRGRDEGEVPRLFREAFSEIGVRPDIVTEVSDELDALQQAMSWAEPGDLILHLVHLEREPIEAYLSDLGACI